MDGEDIFHSVCYFKEHNVFIVRVHLFFHYVEYNLMQVQVHRAMAVLFDMPRTRPLLAKEHFTIHSNINPNI